MHQLVKEHSVYSEITVYESNQLYGKKGKYRFLQFSDDAIQGALNLKEPKSIVLEYPQAIIHLMEHNNPAFEHVFMIGHGIGTIPAHYTHKRFKIAEIDEKVVEISRSYFDYRGNNVAIGDGRELLGNEEPGTHDYIVLDAFTKAGTPTHLTTLEFFQQCRDKLGARGVLLMNLTGRAQNDGLIHAINTTLGEVFPYTKAFELFRESADEQRNIIIAGGCINIEYEAGAMAGFAEMELANGYILRDKQQPG